MTKRRRSKPATTSFHPLAFGGWRDYETWAANDFRPKPRDPAPAPAPAVVEALPETQAAPRVDVPTEPAVDPVVHPGPAPGPEPAPADGPTEFFTAEELAEQPAPTARPYVRTMGRTRAAHELRLETIVSAAPGTPPSADATALRLHRVCRAPLSVAEIAVHLGVPLGVARILISDAITDGLVIAHDDRTPSADGPSLELLNRVHAGLLRLA
ncbi:DUF742 domain-containing protein [Saccharothrix lopnurensis]|uniref:DUF742 domain-containing protein n=1 Tax=Saccharothrix lopnurensis TaxID=1670621 RepID=A0ABW1PIM9_9PSEU